MLSEVGHCSMTTTADGKCNDHHVVIVVSAAADDSDDIQSYRHCMNSLASSVCGEGVVVRICRSLSAQNVLLIRSCALA